MRSRRRKTYSHKNDNYVGATIGYKERFYAKRKRHRILTWSLILLSIIIIIAGYLFINKGAVFGENIFGQVWSWISGTKEVDHMKISVQDAIMDLEYGVANPASALSDGEDTLNNEEFDDEIGSAGEQASVEMQGASTLEQYKEKYSNKSGTKSSNQEEDGVTVKASDPVTNDYFTDAVFIGDSRTEGLFINTGLSNATFYAHKGLSIEKVFTEKVITEKKKQLTVMEALGKNQFNKVYIMFGVNELGWPYNDIFKEKYQKVIKEVKKLQPNAVIYIQEVLPITEKLDNESNVFSNKKVKSFNKVIKEIAEEEKVYYLKVGDAIKNKKGVLPKSASSDGVHLSKSACLKWLEYLKTHTAEGSK